MRQEDKFGETKFTYHVKNVHKDNSSTATGGFAPGPGWPQWTRRALSPPGGRCLNHEDKFGESKLNLHVKKVLKIIFLQPEESLLRVLDGLP